MRSKKKSLKRKSDSILEVLEKHNKEMVDKMDSMHQEKMQKFDRLLNLYETELNSRSGKMNFMILVMYLFIFFQASSH